MYKKRLQKLNNIVCNLSEKENKNFTKKLQRYELGESKGNQHELYF